jgi:hypothetical protein
MGCYPDLYNYLLAKIDAMSTSPQFGSAWGDYRRRRRWFFAAWLGGFAIVASLAALFDKFSLGGAAFWILGPAWMISFVVVAARLQLFKCPRCHRPSFNTVWYGNPLARRCVHWGLAKWSSEGSNDTSIR